MNRLQELVIAPHLDGSLSVLGWHLLVHHLADICPPWCACFYVPQVRTSEIMEVSRTEFMTPSAFIFLYENQLFLTFRNRKVAVWNFKGEMVTSFEDHLLWYPDCNTNNIYITADQDLILSYCKPEDERDSAGRVLLSTPGYNSMQRSFQHFGLGALFERPPSLEDTSLYTGWKEAH